MTRTLNLCEPRQLKAKPLVSLSMEVGGMGSNPTVTAIKPPVYRGFFWASGRREKELRMNDGEPGPIELVGRIIASPTVEPIYAPIPAETR